MDLHVIKKLSLKSGTTESTVTKISNMFEKQGNFLANGQNEDGSYYIVLRFDDEMHWLAFQVWLSHELNTNKER